MHPEVHESLTGTFGLVYREDGEIFLGYNVPTRKIIAALQRCAWLDKAATYHDIENGDYCRAIRNAEAWTKWGASNL